MSDTRRGFLGKLAAMLGCSRPVSSPEGVSVRENRLFYMTTEWLQDANCDIESYIRARMAEEFEKDLRKAQVEAERQILYGSGDGRVPRCRVKPSCSVRLNSVR